MQTVGTGAAVEALQLYSPTGSHYLPLHLFQFGENQPRKEVSTHWILVSLAETLHLRSWELRHRSERCMQFCFLEEKPMVFGCFDPFFPEEGRCENHSSREYLPKMNLWDQWCEKQANRPTSASSGGMVCFSAGLGDHQWHCKCSYLVHRQPAIHLFKQYIMLGTTPKKNTHFMDLVHFQTSWPASSASSSILTPICANLAACVWIPEKLVLGAVHKYSPSNEPPFVSCPFVVGWVVEGSKVPF